MKEVIRSPRPQALIAGDQESAIAHLCDGSLMVCIRRRTIPPSIRASRLGLST